MSEAQDSMKQMAAVAGADFVKNGMMIGLGSGSTAELLVAELGRRIASTGLDIKAVSTSDRTSALARAAGIQIVEPNTVDHLDLVLDGADEVDPLFRMIKGRGGALLREKIVASAASQKIILIDDTKPVQQLGSRHPLPVEVAHFGLGWTIKRLSAYASALKLRTSPSGEPYITDGGNCIIDMHTGPITNPEQLEANLLAIPGVYETGLFINLCDTLITGSPKGVQVRHRNQPA